MRGDVYRNGRIGFVADPNRTGWNLLLRDGLFRRLFCSGNAGGRWAIESNGMKAMRLTKMTCVQLITLYRGWRKHCILYLGATVFEYLGGMNADGLQITQVTSLDTANVFFTMHVTLKNTTAATVNNVYYCGRWPDNDETLTGRLLWFRQSIPSLPITQSTGCNTCVSDGVTYTMFGWAWHPWLPRQVFLYIINWSTLAPTVSLDTLYNELSTTADYSGTLVQDVGIGLVFSLGNIPAGTVWHYHTPMF